MATYYPTSSSQSDNNLQSSHPGDQTSYSELHHSHLSNITSYMNHAPAGGSYSNILYGGSLSSHEFSSGGARTEMMFIPPTGETMNLHSIGGQLHTAASNLVGDSVSGDSQAVQHRMQLDIPDSELNFQSQGLSLSLGTQAQPTASEPSFQHHYPNQSFSLLLSQFHVPEKWTLPCEGDENNISKDLGNFQGLSGCTGINHNPIKTESLRNPQYTISDKDMHFGMSIQSFGNANTILNPRYLKAAQHLLDEVVNVKKAMRQPEWNKCSDESKETDKRSNSHSILAPSNEMPSDLTESTADSTPELSPVEQQELQNKKTKLLSMLDKVDKKYKQYSHQMQILVSSFDMVAGRGAAKSYTALALQTISRHFRCLCDTISGQIEIIRKKLGEKDSSKNGQGRIPRLRYLDHQIRQQRALQQLGVMRHAWRPQRGLPESSVSVLRAWLFEHFLHPYPSDTEKITLARQAGLSRNQVGNWFINARVRLWKPMVEDMYKEEFGDSETNSKSSLDEAINAYGDKSENHFTTENKLHELHKSTTSTAADSAHQGKVRDLKSNNHNLELEMKEPIAKPVLESGSHGPNVAESGIMKFQHYHRLNVDNNNFGPQDENIPSEENGDGNLMSAAVSYDVSDLNGFAVGSQMSLALGLQSHESDAFPMFGGAHMRANNIAASSVGPNNVDYHCMDSGKQQDRFTNSRLLHDFVA